MDRKEEIRRERERELQDIRKLLSSSEGRRVLWRLLSFTGLYRSSFTGNSETFFNEGKRSVGLWLTKELTDADDEKFYQMAREAKANQVKKLKGEREDGN